MLTLKQSQTIAYEIRGALYLNITDRCTLACAFCPKFNGTTQVHDFDLALDHRPEVAEIIATIGDPGQYSEIVFCGYGEPTLRLKVLLAVADYVKGHGGKVRINTDGLANRVHKRDVLPEMAGKVDALSVSLNAQDAVTYARHCRPALPDSFEAVLAFLKAAPQYIPEVTATAIEGLEGVDMDACERLAAACGVHFRRRRLDIVG
ncbi:MAG: TatD family nuclease-associated radical SAM protein [Gammaproteobacteria bacterium]|nr:TatD family nuclease-associated radical SAM protein [Gammaproteobacteria bacterium]MBU1655791.1 TatD family nuclease-associated radical SAM protein [Gammaproteobacteria bacterium]MBU1960046.1 TatD family nuclease-associated radical SAM protein [Gammaproteobacteria bacterium]